LTSVTTASTVARAARPLGTWVMGTSSTKRPAASSVSVPVASIVTPGCWLLSSHQYPVSPV
jgi:hypothetical protein